MRKLEEESFWTYCENQEAREIAEEAISGQESVCIAQGIECVTCSVKGAPNNMECG